MISVLKFYKIWFYTLEHEGFISAISDFIIEISIDLSHHVGLQYLYVSMIYIQLYKVKNIIF